MLLLGLGIVLIKIQQPQQIQQFEPQVQQTQPIIIENVHPNYNVGYEHARMGLRPSFELRDNPHYINGYREGARHCTVPGFKFEIGFGR